MSQVTNLAFFSARRGQSEALGAALAALVEPTRLEAGGLPKVKYTPIELRGKILVLPVKAAYQLLIFISVKWVAKVVVNS